MAMDYPGIRPIVIPEHAQHVSGILLRSTAQRKNSNARNSIAPGLYPKASPSDTPCESIRRCRCGRCICSACTRAATRKGQVGSGDRSERIRTYNFPQGRVTDHRIGLTLYKLDQVMEGDLGDIVDALVAADQAAKLAEMQA